MIMLFSSEYPPYFQRTLYRCQWTPTGSTHLIGFQPKVKAIALIPAAVTQHTTACCSTQVVDITPMKHRSTSIKSLRVVQQKHRRSKARLQITTQYHTKDLQNLHDTSKKVPYKENQKKQLVDYSTARSTSITIWLAIAATAMLYRYMFQYLGIGPFSTH